MDVDVLLRGAERLCGVYAAPGALERVAALRARHLAADETLAYYEARVAEQARALERINLDRAADRDRDLDRGADEDALTMEDLRREEAEVRELERKKGELQQRLKAMDQDLIQLGR